MKRQSVLWIVLFVCTLGLILLTPRLLASQNPPVVPESQNTQVAQGMMQGSGMMGSSDCGQFTSSLPLTIRSSVPLKKFQVVFAL
jgi:hypothetical protein